MSSDNVYAHTKAQEPHKNSAEEDFLSTFFSSSYDPSSLNSDILGPSVLYGTSEKSDFGNSSSNHDIDASSNIGSWLQTQNDDDFINLVGANHSQIYLRLISALDAQYIYREYQKQSY